MVRDVNGGLYTTKNSRLSMCSRASARSVTLPLARDLLMSDESWREGTTRELKSEEYRMQVNMTRLISSDHG
jgi:hypothetical protein